MKENVDLTEGRDFSLRRDFNRKILDQDLAIKKLFKSKFKAALRILPWQDRCFFHFLPKKIRVPGQTVFIKHIIFSEGTCQCCGGTCIPWRQNGGLCEKCKEHYNHTENTPKVPWRNTNPIPSAENILRI